ncbi:MAG: hypothetical protein HYS26_03065 [Candidatus Kaiserbacteria bacterium]|nr:MAG: hypothetical protein HYS26_03065 [Candidatus Kaiserbacteria bacterium]
MYRLLKERRPGMVLSAPPERQTAKQAQKYIRMARRDLELLYRRGKKGPQHLRYIGLSNGRRAGWFTNARTALTELMAETVDKARERSGTWTPDPGWSRNI